MDNEDLQAFGDISVDIDKIAKDVFLPLSEEADCVQMFLDPSYADTIVQFEDSGSNSLNCSPLSLSPNETDVCQVLEQFADDCKSSLITFQNSPKLSHFLPAPNPCGTISNRFNSRTTSEKRKRKQDIAVRANDHLEFVEVATENCNNNNEYCQSPLKAIQNEISAEKSPKLIMCELLTVGMIDKRKESILRKMAATSSSAHIQFTEMEEYDIMQRANIFLNNIKPDKELCLAPGESRPEELLACSMSYLDAPIYEYQNDGAYTLQHHANPQPVYVIDERSYVVFKENKNRIVLPLGTQLLKPGRKLVELVAIAIDSSPDGLLQVQQVYSYLMLKYPYFAFMDKLTTSSWRSSIRHALYQKWFKKIAVCDEKIGSKGCFWAINRDHTPKEWTLPKLSSPVKCVAGDRAASSIENVTVLSGELTKPLVSASQTLTDLQRCIQEQRDADKMVVESHKPRPPPVVWQPQARYGSFGKPARTKGPYNYGLFRQSTAAYGQPATPYHTSRLSSPMPRLRASMAVRFPTQHSNNFQRPHLSRHNSCLTPMPPSLPSTPPMITAVRNYPNSA